MATGIRVLLVADSHLGLDLPTNPRIQRRRRGHDFLANHRAALEPALSGGVDLVVHGGDVFDRPGVPMSLAYQAYEPLLQVAERGVPVLVVPGNHERSRLPHARLAVHPRVHVFDRPRTVVLEVRGRRVALSGFPYERRDVRARFPQLLGDTCWTATQADVRLLCLHHCVEGATVGPGDFTFTTAADVVRHADVPPAFAAVLSGHIHRRQVLTRDLRGRPLVTPVLYPGSVERTSSAEIGEDKGYLLLDVAPGEGAVRVHWEYRPLPARPMLVEELDLASLRGRSLESAVRAVIAAAPPDAVLRICLQGEPRAAESRALSAARLRALAPETMNIELRLRDVAPARRAVRGPAPRRPRQHVRPAIGSANLQLEL